MLRQRLRGILGMTVLTCIPWMSLGLLAGAVFRFGLIPGIHGSLGRPYPGGLMGAGLTVGAVIGLLNGLAFSLILLAAERGKTLGALRRSRFAAWGALATGGTLGLLFTSPTAAVMGGVVGAIGGAAALGLVRRDRMSTLADAAPVSAT